MHHIGQQLFTQNKKKAVYSFGFPLASNHNTLWPVGTTLKICPMTKVYK